MPNLKISAFTSGTPAGTDEIPFVRGAAPPNYKTTFANTPLSIFNNDSGFISSPVDLATDVTALNGMSCHTMQHAPHLVDVKLYGFVIKS